MKILHVFSNYKWTGPAEPAVSLAAELHRRGHDVTFASPDVPPHESDRRVWQHAVDRGLAPLMGLHLSKHLHLVNIPRDASTLRAFLLERDFQLIHAHMRNDHLVAALATRRMPLPPPIVRSVYDGRLEGGLRDRYLFGRHTARAIFLSGKVLDAAVRSKLMRRERCSLLEGAVDLERFDPGRPLPDMRRALGLGPRDYVVGIVARVQWHRRYNVLLAAVEQAMRALPHFRMVVIGRGTCFHDILEKPVQRRGLGGAVRFAGYLTGDDYVGCLAALDAKVFLVPGSDGSCRAVREAMAMGLPVIAANRGMLPEIVKDGETGRIVSDTAENLSRAIIELGDEPVRRRMAVAARERAVRDFDVESQAARVESIYEELLLWGR
ncbi:MAG TPA: glycosyltransferase family 4 protein [Planctomycetota bacterium]|nr:glycosyltransferase family 4 protein [Planctomycetota bacterium]